MFLPEVEAEKEMEYPEDGYGILLRGMDKDAGAEVLAEPTGVDSIGSFVDCPGVSLDESELGLVPFELGIGYGGREEDEDPGGVVVGHAP